MIIVGGLTRLTDSGLSITKWQLFTGVLPPLNNNQWNEYFELYKEIPEFKLQNYLMSLKEFKVIFWWEFIHRFLGRLIGIFFILPLIFFSIKLGFSKTKNLYTIFILICFQGFIGWYMVSSGLIDRVDVSHYRLSLHLFLAFIILSLIFWNYLKCKNINYSQDKIKNFLPITFLLLIFIQIIIGAFVSGMDAGKIYNSWPLMGGSYYPDDNVIENLFNLSVFNEPSLMQFVHRNLAYLIFFFYLLIFINVYKNKLSTFFKATNIIGLLLFLQIVLGILTLLSGAQMFIASMHQINSIFLVSSSIYLVYLNFYSNLQPLD
jgi:cytochrome c oxidase assembly protein subunit 15